MHEVAGSSLVAPASSVIVTIFPQEAEFAGALTDNGRAGNLGELLIAHAPTQFTYFSSSIIKRCSSL